MSRRWHCNFAGPAGGRKGADRLWQQGGEPTAQHVAKRGRTQEEVQQRQWQERAAATNSGVKAKREAVASEAWLHGAQDDGMHPYCAGQGIGVW